VKKSQTFSTAADNQSSVEIHVLQGERPMAKDNVSLGKFILDGIPAAPRGLPQIEVSFAWMQTAFCMSPPRTSDRQGAIHQDFFSSKLTKDEVEKFVKQAEQFADEDKKHRDEIEAKNELDGLVYATENHSKTTVTSFGDERLAIDRLYRKPKTRSRRQCRSDEKGQRKTLTQASHKLAEAIYKEAPLKLNRRWHGCNGGSQFRRKPHRRQWRIRRSGGCGSCG